MKNSTFLHAGVSPCMHVLTASAARRQFRRTGSTLFGIACILALLVTSTPVTLNAQTEWKDREISIAREDQTNPAVAHPTQTAQTVTVWEDRRDDATGTDIYIQCIDNSSGVPQWVAAPVNTDAVKDRFDGMAVCRADNDQRNPRAAYDGMNGVIVVWEDYRNDPTLQVAEIWAQRIDLLTGLPDPAWPLDGIPVCQTGYHAERPRIAGTMDGAFITWIDHRNNLWSPVNRDVYVQYIKSASATFPPPPTSWVANGISVSANPQHDQINPELDVENIVTLDMLGLMTQGVVITYQDDRYLGATSGLPVWSVFVNRISADGNQLYTFGGLGGDVAVDASTGEHQRLPRIVTTGKQTFVTDRRAIVVWEDDVGGGASSTDVYFQAISNLGFPPNNQPGQPYWSNSTPVCTAPGVQTGPIPVLFEYFNQSTQTYIPYVTVGWEDHRDYAVNGIDLYGGLIDAITPAIVNPGAMNGDIISALPYDQTQLSMDNIGLSSSYDNTVFVWKHFNGAEANIHYQKISIPGWMLLQPLHGFPVTEAKADQVLPQANKEVFVWQDGRRDPIPGDNQDDENIYAQTPGECTGPTGMKWRDKFAYWTYGNNAENFRMATDTVDGTTYVVWDEDRYPFGQPGDAAKIVFIQKFDKDGVPRWSNNGVALSIYNVTSAKILTLDASLPDVCIDGAGGARVVWQQKNFKSKQWQIIPVHIDASATIDYSKGVAWVNALIPMFEPRITAINDNAFHAVVAGIGATATGNEVFTGMWVSTSPYTLNVPKLSTGFAQPAGIHTDLHVMYDGGKWVYTLSRDTQNSNIDITEYDAVNNWTPVQTTVVPGIFAFGGHDLNIDNNNLATGTAALYAYSYKTAPGVPFDVYMGHYRAGGFMSPPVQLTTNALPTESTQPAITGDIILNTAEMGALVAWDTKYTDPITFWVYHRVESNRVIFPGPATAFPSNFMLASALPGPSNPDISRVINRGVGNYSPRAVVVWEGGGESSPCSPARPAEIYAQYMDYDPQSVNSGPQWPQPEMVGPGPGNYMQTRPTVKQSIPSTVAVFWSDTQAGNQGIMGTRMDVRSTVIDWAKRTRDEALPIQPGQMTIIDVWPQPAHVSGEVAVTLQADVDATVSFELYDLLGRRIAVLYSGFMERSELTVRFSPSAYDLNTGTYLLRARSEEGQTSRTITVVR